MSSFTGVSIITDGKHCTTTAIDTDADSGYHLLVVKDYSRTLQGIPHGEVIGAGPIMVGGHEWYIWYSPNGEDPSCADFISLDLSFHDDNVEEIVEVKFEFSFVDEVEKQKPKEILATGAYDFSIDGRSCGPVNFMKRSDLERSAHLKDDCFTIRCDIVICKDLDTHDTDGTISDIHQHFDSLLQNKVGADVTFEVSGETFAAHRCVLAARSKVFMAQLFGPMTEGTTSSAIQIKDMRAKVFAALLKFIYTDSFPEMDKDNYMEEEAGQKGEQGQEEEEGKDEEEGQEEDVMWLQWLQDLLVAADRYDLQRLKFLCGKQLSEHISVSSVTSTLALAEQLHCHKLKEVCFNFIQVQSPKCLDKVMATDGWEHMSTTYPSVLKELVAKLVSNQMGKKRKQ
ncbi:unnamed protein product [Alopecurus aequalis]